MRRARALPAILSSLSRFQILPSLFLFLSPYNGEKDIKEEREFFENIYIEIVHMCILCLADTDLDPIILLRSDRN